MEGLLEVSSILKKQGVKFTVVKGRPPDPILLCQEESCCMVLDCGYTRTLQGWRRELLSKSATKIVLVEGEVVVPTEVASKVQEPAAATFRPKISKWIDKHLVAAGDEVVQKPSLDLDFDRIFDGHKEFQLTDMNLPLEEIMKQLCVDRTVPPCSLFLQGGESKVRCSGWAIKDDIVVSQAEELLSKFLTSGTDGKAINEYHLKRNDPSLRK
eukprot:759111-Hanusia_phi.AAC.3